MENFNEELNLHDEVLTGEVVDTEILDDQETTGLSTGSKVGIAALAAAGVTALWVATKKPRAKAKRKIAEKVGAWSAKALEETEPEEAEVVEEEKPKKVSTKKTTKKEEA